MPTFSLRVAAILVHLPLPRFWRDHLAACIRVYVLDGAEINFRHIVCLAPLPFGRSRSWQGGLMANPEERC